MKGKIFFASLLFIGTCAVSDVNAGFTIKNGRIVDADTVATFSAEEHYRMGVAAMELCDWKEAARQFCIVSCNFPSSAYGQEGYYLLGVSYYQLAEYDFANEAFSQYIKAQSQPKYFLDAVYYKYAIAEQFRCGAKRRFFGTKHLPKWACGEAMALTIYDEVINAMPGHEIAAQALYSKGCLLLKQRDFRCSIEAFQSMIRRFPKNELTPDAYLLISKAYLEQSYHEFQNSDILAFAEINLRRFKKAFPRDERICVVERDVLNLKEVYAHGLYETGQFYERINECNAAKLYYRKAIKKFPETRTAQRCVNRMMCLDQTYCYNPNRDADVEQGELLRDVPNYWDAEPNLQNLDFSEIEVF